MSNQSRIYISGNLNSKIYQNKQCVCSVSSLNTAYFKVASARRSHKNEKIFSPSRAPKLSPSRAPELSPKKAPPKKAKKPVCNKSNGKLDLNNLNFN